MGQTRLAFILQLTFGIYRKGRGASKNVSFSTDHLFQGTLLFYDYTPFPKEEYVKIPHFLQ